MKQFFPFVFLAFAQLGCAQNQPSNCNTVLPETKISDQAENVLGTPLQSCCFAPTTGFYRDGFCHTGSNDRGVHITCAQMTEDFLEYTKAQGNDLSTPTSYFPGLKPGDHWCLCISRWKEAVDAGHGPPIVLEATHEAALRYVSMELLKEYAVKE